MRSFSVVPVLALLLLFSAPAQAGSKVQICHLPPGNPLNFHTITVSEKALPAHLAHGDFAESCFANAEVLCDDGNACTIDAMDAATETCIAEHPAVDCDDSLLCTTDSCDPANGCQYAPIVCDDLDACTVDTCNPFDGQCTGAPIDCGALGVCEPDSGLCDFPCDGITCDPISQCHEAGVCVLPGACVDGAPVADGTACDDGDAGTIDDECTGGACAGVPGEKLVFITSQIYVGNLGGLSGADGLCNFHAASAGLPGTYMAWLGTSAGTPNTRFTPAAVPYVRTDGVPIANNYVDLADGSLLAPINVDEFANPIPAGERLVGAAWSAVDAFGNLAAFTGGRRCGEWTTADGSNQGFKGNADAVDASWTGFAGTSFNCKFQPARLYCFEQ